MHHIINRSAAMECPHATSCPLFKQFTQNSLLEFWKDRFCNVEDRWPTCKRFELSKTGSPVPLTLMPNGAQLGRR